MAAVLLPSPLLAGASKKSEVPAIAPASERTIGSGRIVGFEDKRNTYAWLNIPYAAPPVKDLRWKAPRPVQPWTDVRPSLAFGNVCPQLGSRLSGTEVHSSFEVTGDEDCLYLNVWAPRTVKAGVDKLPVMVWIHGGGNSIGTANTYKVAHNLAGDYQVIMVTLNYRLGVLGWFRHPALDKEDSTPEDKSGNYGTLDQVAALRWVRDNIANFGGDPQNVTIFGESAGGMNTFALLMSPLAKGLFHRAIVQSGVPVTTPLDQATHFVDDEIPGEPGSSNDVLSRLMLAEKRADTPKDAKSQLRDMRPEEIAAYLRGQSAETLIGLFKGPGLGMYSSPDLIRDGLVLPVESPDTILADPTRYNVVPTLMGTNRDEMKLFMSFSRALVRWRLGILPKVKNVDHYNRVAAYLSDVWRVAGVNAPASRMSTRGQPPIFAYRFDWDEEPSKGLVDFSTLFGAAHGLEIAFVFHDLDREMNLMNLWNDDNEAGRVPLTNAMASYWTQFAYTGTPGRGRDGSLPEWTPWQGDENAPRKMILDTVAGGGVRMEKEQLTVTALKARLANDPAFAHNPEGRCELYVKMFSGIGRWVGWWDPKEYQSFGPDGCAAYPWEKFQLKF